MLRIRILALLVAAPVHAQVPGGLIVFREPSKDDLHGI